MICTADFKSSESQTTPCFSKWSIYQKASCTKQLRSDQVLPDWLYAMPFATKGHFTPQSKNTFWSPGDVLVKTLSGSNEYFMPKYLAKIPFTVQICSVMGAADPLALWRPLRGGDLPHRDGTTGVPHFQENATPLDPTVGLCLGS